MIKDLYPSFPAGSTLHGCGSEGCAALAQHWTVAIYPARSMIVSEADTDTDVFFILSGSARAATYTDTGREVLLSELPPGECFGLFAAIDGQPRSTNVVAVEEARIARMSAAHFNQVLDARRDVMRAFLHYLVDRIRQLSSRMTAATTLSTDRRLMAEILRLARGSEAGADRAVIDPFPTQQEIATLLFSQRESIARELSKLKEAGLVERKGRRLEVHSLARLRARLGD